MLVFYAYMACLAIAALFCVGVAIVRHDKALSRSALAVGANWLAGTAVSFAGWTDAWPLNIPLDAATAFLILFCPAGKWQSALGVSYCVQIIAHVAYGSRELLGFGADATEYYNQLTLVAFIQLALLGGWGIGVWLRRITVSERDRRATTLDARASSMAES